MNIIMLVIRGFVQSRDCPAQTLERPGSMVCCAISRLPFYIFNPINSRIYGHRLIMIRKVCKLKSAVFVKKEIRELVCWVVALRLFEVLGEVALGRR